VEEELLCEAQWIREVKNLKPSSYGIENLTFEMVP
jgi:hypothetical protein